MSADLGAKEVVAPNFIKNIVIDDLESGKHKKIITRFPPEPNGYLHIGHAKAICLSFGLAKEFNGQCHLRFDDTNPEKESIEYINSIKKDVEWLGFSWGDNLFYASDYFQKLHDYAIYLIKAGKAYVCNLNPEEVRIYRGSLKEAGKDSPYRNRSIEENLELFEKMKKGEFAEGECTLRAKIDMASPNMNMRDPAIYRIRKVHHHRTGDEWQIYPMYDYTHCISDSLEMITHSTCTLEFEDHRVLYDWFLDQLDVPSHPRQIEFARLNLDYTVMSKRKLLSLVEEKHVDGWDDPRMPTISGMRRRGVLPQSIRSFCEQVGITKKESCISLSTLESAIRDDLNDEAVRVFGVLEPLKITITNFDKEVEYLSAPFHPHKPELGDRKIPLRKEVYIDRSDFMEDPPKKFFRLGPDREVRLRYGYVIKCNEIIKDSEGNIIELKCTYDKETGGGVTPEGQKKVKGIIHWVSVQDAVEAEVRLYDRLFQESNPGIAEDYRTLLNPDSLQAIKAFVEPSVKELGKRLSWETRFQFERMGYFWIEPQAVEQNEYVFNRIITLKDSWSKLNS